MAKLTKMQVAAAKAVETKRKNAEAELEGLTPQQVAAKKAWRKRRARQAALKAWATRRKNTES